MDAGFSIWQWFVNAFFLSITALIYSRMIVTTDLNVVFSTSNQFSPSSLEVLRHLGPIRYRDARVLSLTGMITLPAWTSPLLVGTSLHDLMIWIAIGAMLAPLMVPTSLMPTRSDLNDPARVFIKWIFAKLDVLLKTSFLLLIFTALSYIPTIGNLGKDYASTVFPIVADESATGFFSSIQAGILGLTTVMLIFRLGISFTHGFIFVLLISLATPFLWVQIQWYVSEEFIPLGASPEAVRSSLLAVFATSVIQDTVRLILPDNDPRIISSATARS